MDFHEADAKSGGARRGDEGYGGDDGGAAQTAIFVSSRYYVCLRMLLYVSACYCISGRGDGGYEGENALIYMSRTHTHTHTHTLINSNTSAYPFVF
jgi:hypothetical protein